MVSSSFIGERIKWNIMGMDGGWMVWHGVLFRIGDRGQSIERNAVGSVVFESVSWE